LELRAAAAEALSEAETALEKLEIATYKLDDVDLPEFKMPEPEYDDEPDEPLVSSDMDLEDHIAALRKRKSYEEE
jgi:hypothetical protein